MIVALRNDRLYFSSAERKNNVEVGEGEWPFNIWPCMYYTTGCLFFSSKVVARDFVHIECYVGRSVYSTSLVSPMYSEHLAKLDQHLDDSLVHGACSPLLYHKPFSMLCENCWRQRLADNETPLQEIQAENSWRRNMERVEVMNVHAEWQSSFITLTVRVAFASESVKQKAKGAWSGLKSGSRTKSSSTHRRPALPKPPQ